MTGWPRRPAALLALAFAWLAFTAWVRPLALPDEGRYIGVAWEMVRSGEWLTPTLDGLPYFHKPPLFYWITGAALSLFGNVEWAGRVAPWSGSCLMVASAFLFGRRWLGEAAGRAWTLALATMPLVFMSAQYANLDMLVAGWITATILAFAHASLLPLDDPSRRKWLIAGGALAAGATLAKGLIGFVLPGMVLVAWLLLARRWRRILSLFWWPVLLVFLAVAAPWFVVMQQRFDDFLHYFFVVQHFSRYTEAGFNNAHGPWFFPVVLALLSMPWTLWLLRRAPAQGAASDDARAVRVLAWVWLVAIVAFFSLPRSKLVGYVLPAVPPLALLVALRWQAWREADVRGARLATATAALAVVLCVGAVVGSLRVQKHTRELARVTAQEPARPVAFVQAYYFDFAFYARLREPAAVIDRWDDPELTRADNWRRELLDAAQFLPGKASPLLLPAALAATNCPGARSWVVGGADMPGLYPLLTTHGRQVARRNGTVLWELRDWVPVAAQCAGGTPSASSAGKS